MAFLLILAALAAGVAGPFQSGMNSELNKQLGGPFWTAIVVYMSGLFSVCLLQLCTRHFVPLDSIASVPWWAWMGGAISVVPTLIALTFAQRMGAGIFTGTSVTAALVTSVVLDHFGWIGFRQHAASPARLVGCGFMVAGVWILTRF